MSKDYGMMIGCADALMWVSNLKDVNDGIRERVLHRMEYEFDKSIPVKRVFHKGKYGHKYDTYSCGNCGAGLPEACWSYCPSCGFAIAKDTWQERQRESFLQVAKRQAV